MHTLRAPQRTTVSPTSFKLSLTRENEEIASDRLYVGATNESLNSYEIGRDLSKVGDPLEAKEAQIWVNAYGMKLCDIDMPLNNNVAACDLSVFAPQAGQYTLAVERAQENTVLYLTYNGRPIWNLTMSPYMFDLEKGTTEGYGLQLYVRQSPEVATGVDGVQDAEIGVQKVLINDKMYLITPEGAMFDATGKKIQ